MTETESQQQLAARVAAAAKQVTVGARYRHYKGQDYTVLAIALLEANNEPCVIYRAEYGAHVMFVRLVAMWLETVEQEGKTVNRFTKMDP